jgi:hypothetical protein
MRPELDALFSRSRGASAACSDRSVVSPLDELDPEQEARLADLVNNVRSTPISAFASFASRRTAPTRRRQEHALLLGALGGVIVASACFMLSGMLVWALSRPAIAESPPLLRTVHDLAHLAGGPVTFSRSLSSWARTRPRSSPPMCSPSGSPGSEPPAPGCQRWQ